MYCIMLSERFAHAYIVITKQCICSARSERREWLSRDVFLQPHPPQSCAAAAPLGHAVYIRNTVSNVRRSPGSGFLGEGIPCNQTTNTY